MRLSKLPRIASLLAAAVIPLLANANACGQSVDEFLEKGDVFDRKLEANEALPLYLAAEKLDPQNPRILVCIARQYRHLMSDASTKQEKLRLGHIAMDYSERAAALGPRNCEAQLATAITLGKMLPVLPAREQADASPRIKDSVDKALALDPRNDIAWHILGRWHRVLADVNAVKRALAGIFYGGLPQGSIQEAEHAMQKAIALNPNRPMHYIELGRIYAQMGKNEEARRFINEGLAMPNTDKDDPETKQHGRETLSKLP